MKSILLSSLVFLISIKLINAQEATEFEKNEAFTFGEKATYKLHYNLYYIDIPVGEVTFEVKNKPVQMRGINHYHIRATGRTYRFYDPFFKVRDIYETFINPNTFLPIAAIRIIHEGKYSCKEYTIFDHKNKIAINKKEDHTSKINITSMTQDILSSIYLARTFNYDNAKPGDSFMIHTFIDDSTYIVGVVFDGREVLRIASGKYKCIRLKPILIIDRVFESEDDMMLWVSDDKNRVPIKIFSGISVGAIKVEISDYDNLKNKFSSKL